MFCRKCGTENKDDASFCSKCGNDLKSVNPEIDIKDTTGEWITAESLKRIGAIKPERKGITGKLGKMGIPGFRSRKTWKMVLATLVYFFIGILVLVVGTAIIAAFVFGMGTPTETNTPSAIQPTTNIQSMQTTQSTPVKTKTPVIVGTYESPASVGTMLSDDYTEFTVLEVNKEQQAAIEAESKYLPEIPSGYTLHLIKIQIKNIGNKEFTFIPTIAIKVFKDGLEVDLDTIMKMTPPKQFPEVSRSGTIMPGATSSGWWVIYVPKDTDYLIQYKSSPLAHWVKVT